MKTLLSGFLLLAVLCSTVKAKEWSRFRGPNGSGVAENVSFPAEWSSEDYAWQTNLPGGGHGSPIGWKDAIYVTAGSEKQGDVSLICIAASDGTHRWQYEAHADSYRMHAANSFASCTPVADERHVYFCLGKAGQLQVIAVTHAGNFAWKRDLGEYAGAHGFGVSPMVVGDVVCIQCDTPDGGFLAGLEATSGEVRWKVERPAGKASYSTPCVFKTNQEGKVVEAVVSISMEGGMQAIEATSGELLWNLPDVFPARTVSSPLLVGNRIFGQCGGGGNGKALVAVTIPDNGDKPGQPDVFTRDIPYVPTPVVVGDRMYLWHDRGKVNSLDMNTGKSLWVKRVGGNYFGSPVVAGDKIYCISTEGTVVSISAGDKFEVLGRTELGKATNSTPAVFQGKMYFRAGAKLFCLPAEG